MLYKMKAGRGLRNYMQVWLITDGLDVLSVSLIQIWKGYSSLQWNRDAKDFYSCNKEPYLLILCSATIDGGEKLSTEG